MIDSVWSWLGLALAGVLSGLFGSVAGLASLASYPALLAAGLSPVTANVTNTIALIGTGTGSSLGSRPELVGQAGRIRSWAPIMLIGGASGAAAVLVLPSSGFELVVPVLVAGASVLVLVRNRVQQFSAAEAELGDPDEQSQHPHARTWAGTVGLFVIAFYGGYFGAGAGVLTIVLLAVLTHESLLRVNALKNVLLWFANGIAALGFAVFGPVVWSAALPLGIGCLIGGTLGPRISRRMPTTVLRYLIAAGGFVLAIKLGWTAYR